eukprot:6184800-Pleurochrysis_carterae.AAC.3
MWSQTASPSSLFDAGHKDLIHNRSPRGRLFVRCDLASLECVSSSTSRRLQHGFTPVVWDGVMLFLCVAR